VTKVFGKNKPTYDWCPTLTKWKDDTKSPFYSTALNIEIDDRVPASRARSLASFAKRLGGLELANPSYMAKRVNVSKKRVHPEFVLRTNKKNLVTTIPESEELAWVLDLTALENWDVCKKIMSRIAESEKTVPDKSEPPNGYFHRKLGAVPPDFEPTQPQKRVLKTILAVLSHETFQPKWVTLFSLLRDHRRDGPDRWLQLLGLPRDENHYLAVVKYPRNQIALYRPCCVDALAHAHHYPSPGGRPPSEGGSAMDLGSPKVVRPSLSPLSEYIHQHHPFDDAEVAWLGITTQTVGSRNVREYRRRHKKRLLKHLRSYKTQILDWPD
jgi:hypothetical protein